ncbi:MAG: hypothetical protein KAH38_00940, partial [Candidatus Hydrogenedentes bacterium]|nr:hypothetical protein [Candidatus Hydrogenedentota bacterium]
QKPCQCINFLWVSVMKCCDYFTRVRALSCYSVTLLGLVGTMGNKIRDKVDKERLAVPLERFVI